MINFRYLNYKNSYLQKLKVKAFFKVKIKLNVDFTLVSLNYFFINL